MSLDPDSAQESHSANLVPDTQTPEAEGTPASEVPAVREAPQPHYTISEDEVGISRWSNLVAIKSKPDLPQTTTPVASLLDREFSVQPRETISAQSSEDRGQTRALLQRQVRQQQ